MTEVEQLKAENAELKALLLKKSGQGKICKNCGKVFLPKRSDTIYCNNPSPQECRLSCSEYNSQRLCYKRMRRDPVAQLSRNILSAKGMAARRNPKKLKDYDYFRRERLVWKKKYENGEINAEEYRTWLISMKG